MFWYFYPDSYTVAREWETKILPLMPQGQFEKHPQYGWKLVRSKGAPSELHFNSGVSCYFFFYTKTASKMQAGTVHEIFCDEELPVNFYDELILRLTVTGGIFNMVCTPTLNQPFWHDVMDREALPNAHKQQVSMYDCLTYEDGTPSTVFTLDMIKEVESKCKSETEIQRRVHGKFVTESGRIYPTFELKHYGKMPEEARTWSTYAGVDIGSGGTGGHPAAMVFIKVRPDFKKGYVFRAWRGDGVPTTAGDILTKFDEVRGELRPVLQVYDHQSKDFGTIAERIGESFQKANKAQQVGEDILNTLFKNNMLTLVEGDPEIEKLGGELLSVMMSTPKPKRKDDLADACRFAAVSIPWDFSDIRPENNDEELARKPRILTEKDIMMEQIALRRGEQSTIRDALDLEPMGWGELDGEFEFWNQSYSPED